MSQLAYGTKKHEAETGVASAGVTQGLDMVRHPHPGKKASANILVQEHHVDGGTASDGLSAALGRRESDASTIVSESDMLMSTTSTGAHERSATADAVEQAAAASTSGGIGDGPCVTHHEAPLPQRQRKSGLSKSGGQRINFEGDDEEPESAQTAELALLAASENAAQEELKQARRPKRKTTAARLDDMETLLNARLEAHSAKFQVYGERLHDYHAKLRLYHARLQSYDSTLQTYEAQLQTVKAQVSQMQEQMALVSAYFETSNVKDARDDGVIDNEDEEDEDEDPMEQEL